MHLPRPGSFVSLVVASTIFVFNLACLAPSLHAQADAWTFANVLSPSLVSISKLSVTPNGAVLVRANLNGKDGLYRFQGDKPTTVIETGTFLPNKEARLDQVGDFHADAQERVVVVVDVTLPAVPPATVGVSERRCYRWEKDTGTLTRMLPGDTTGTHLPNTMISDGRWLVETGSGLNGARTRSFKLTDGVTATPLGSFTESDTSSFKDKYGTPFTNTSGKMLVTRTYTNDPFNNEEISSTTTELLLFSPDKTEPLVFLSDVYSVNHAPTPDRVTGAKLEAEAFNDDGSILYKLQSFGGAKYDWIETLHLKDLTGLHLIATLSVVEDNADLGGASLDQEGRVAYGKYDGNVRSSDIYSVVNGVSERVTGKGSNILGQGVTDVSLMSVAGPPGVFGDRRSLLLRYITGGVFKYAIATKNLTTWINPAGGDWTTSSNWNPAAVPGMGTATLFNLDATYDVTVGTQAVGSVALEKGSVRFVSPTLTMTGALTVGLDAVFTQSEGTITAGELTIGSLPPLSPTPPPPVAHFNLNNKDTTFTTSGTTIIGGLGEGDLFINDAKMVSTEVRIGAGSKGTAAVSLQNAVWKMESLAVGYSHEASFTIERGASVRSASTVIGLGSEKKNDLATVTLDNTGAPKSSFINGNWTIAGDLTVGSKLPGRLNLFNGASAGVFGPAQTALEYHVGMDDAQINVDGSGGAPEEHSALYFMKDFLMGMKEYVFTRITVSNGGYISSSGNISASHEPLSRTKIVVRGVNANGARSTIDQTTKPTDRFAVGMGGRAILFIREGGLVKCATLLIGNNTDSEGEVYIEGTGGNFASTIEAADMLVVGGNDRVGTSWDAPGILTMGNGATVEADKLIVSPKGRIRGTGVVTTNYSLMMPGSSIEPGIGVQPALTELAQEERSEVQAARAPNGVMAAQAPIRPGTLTFNGPVTIENGATIELDVAGGAPGAADKLVVNGALTLGGTLKLNFTDGYAPKTGDTLDLITATSSTGSFATTTITGLAPGFDYSLAPLSGGGVRLTALNDAAPTTTVQSRLINLSVRTPLAAEQNLIVGFVVQGGAKPMLVRAAGPALAQFLDGTHPDPTITVFDNAKVQTAANDNWTTELTSTFASVGAFPFAASSNDAGLMFDANASYTAHVNGPGNGIVLVELYDAGTGLSPRLINVSARNRVGTGADVLITGFVISGSGLKTVLIRGIGPSLTGFGVTGVLADPVLSVFDSAGTPIAQNDDWPDALAPTFVDVGAFGLASGTKDAALLVTLAPGLYTAQISGAGATSGEALAEIYEVP